MKRVLIIGVVLIIVCTKLSAQNVTDTTKNLPDSTKKQAPLLYPNIAGKALMTPAGWSANGKFIFAGIGGTFPQVYSDRSDLIAVAGFGLGNSYKTVSIAAAININNVSEFDNYSVSIFATHTFPKGSTIGGGALHLFADPDKSDSPPSYYIRYSNTLQNVPSIIPGYSRINYTVGIGSGRFAKNSERDVSTGKNKNGTLVFGNISYEIIKNINLNLEWTGVNLCLTMGLRPWPKLPGINLGIADLTRFSGDKIRFVTSISYAFYLKDKKIK